MFLTFAYLGERIVLFVFFLDRKHLMHEAWVAHLIQHLFRKTKVDARRSAGDNVDVTFNLLVPEVWVVVREHLREALALRVLLILVCDLNFIMSDVEEKRD